MTTPAAGLSLLKLAAAQAPAPGAPTSPQDLAILIGIGVFFFAFAVLGFMALRKKRQERLNILTEASEEADREHGLDDYVSGKKLPPKQDDDVVPDQPVPAGTDSDRAKAEMEAKRAEADAERARREREKAEEAAQEAEADEAAKAAEALEKAKRAEQEAAARADEARQKAEQLKKALAKTREGFFGRIAKAIGGRAIDDDVLEELEAILFTSDIGARTAEKLLEQVKKTVKGSEASDLDKVQAALKDEIISILNATDNPEIGAGRGDGPRVVMVVGVNGAGKTTTIGKLTHQLQSQGHKVLLGAGDTFRAAATEQLEIWAKRNDCEIVKGKEGADPASVLFDAVEKGKADGADIVLCDTAGRLHTKVNLMEELRKVHRVLGKAQEGAPHEVILVLDATVGQNAIQQAKQFGEAVPLTGIVLTKLDGTAKGGVIIGISEELKVPVRYIGVGEQIGDLRRFDARQFAGALFGEDVDLVTPGSSTKGAPVAAA
jgi:fused signal recognition particle receptor